MKHHIIPRFYLKGFTDPDVPGGHNPYVWLYSFDRRVWRRRGVENVAAVAGYYTWTDETGRERQEVEQGLGIIENSVAHILRKKIHIQRPLTVQERLRLGVFIMLMFMRVPFQHRLMHDLASQRGTEILRRQLREWQENPELFEEARRKQEQRTGKTFGDITLEDLNPDSFTVTPNRAATIAASLWIAIHAAPALCSMGWRFLVSRPPAYFVTSDHPFFVVDPSRGRTLHETGLLIPGVEVTFPLTRNVALLATQGNEDAPWTLASSDNVVVMNERSVAAAEYFVAAPKPDVALGDFLEHSQDRAARARRETMDERYPDFRI